MRVAYWIVATLLALLYLYSGGLKVARSRDQLRPMNGCQPPGCSTLPGEPVMTAIARRLSGAG